jgi:uncharacterized protein YabN with tetrapyrrole methylase and pyrophosphatase domain
MPEQPIQPPGGEGMARLRALCAQLRVHCPWDREQTLESMKGLVAAEGAELQAAIEAGDWANLREEVGDVLFNLLLVTRIAEERGLFDWGGVCDAEAAKMIRRHPHVYGDATAGSAAEAIAAFNRAKAAERGAEANE